MKSIVETDAPDAAFAVSVSLAKPKSTTLA
jgi:hypothetical protein